MVDILCPHCEEEIALDDDASGEFVCPYCDGEFEWNVEPEAGLDPNWFQDYNGKKDPSSMVRKIISRGIFGSFFLAGVVMIVVGIAGISISSSLWDTMTESPTSDAPGAGFGAVIILGLIAIGFLLSISLGLSGLGIVLAGLARMTSK